MLPSRAPVAPAPGRADTSAPTLRRGTPVEVRLTGVVWAGADEQAAYVTDTGTRIEIALPVGCGLVVVRPSGAAPWPEHGDQAEVRLQAALEYVGQLEERVGQLEGRLRDVALRGAS